MVEYLLRVSEVLGLIPCTTKEQKMIFNFLTLEMVSNPMNHPLGSTNSFQLLCRKGAP